MITSNEASKASEISEHEQHLCNVINEYDAIIDKIAKNQLRNEEFEEFILRIDSFSRVLRISQPILLDYIKIRLTKALMFNTSITELNAVGIRSLEFIDYILTAIRVNRIIQKLTIKADAITEEGMKKLAEGLTANQSITSLDIACTIGIRDSDDYWASGLVSIIKSNKRITHLVLDNLRLSEEMSKLVCSALLKNTTLTSISLMNLDEGNSGPGLARIQNAFIAMLAKHPSITEINLSHNYLAEEGMQGIKTLLTENQRITYLGLDRVMPGAGVRSIKVPLSKHASLRRLDFSKNFAAVDQILSMYTGLDIVDATADVFAGDLPQTLEEINLKEMNFNISQLQKLANGLKSVPNLRKISLDFRALRAEKGWMKILAEIFNKPTMKSIDCQFKFELTRAFGNIIPEDMKQFSEMLAQHKTLEELTIRCTFGLQKNHPWAKDFASFLKKNMSIRVLNLECVANTLQFLENLEKNKTITKLCFSSHNFTIEIDSLLKLLKKNKTIQFLDLGDEHGPRDQKDSKEMKDKIEQLHKFLKENREAHKEKVRKNIEASVKQMSSSVKALIFSYADCDTEEMFLSSKFQEQRELVKECADGLNPQYQNLSVVFRQQLEAMDVDLEKVRAGKKKTSV